VHMAVAMEYGVCMWKGGGVVVLDLTLRGGEKFFTEAVKTIAIGKGQGKRRALLPSSQNTP